MMRAIEVIREIQRIGSDKPRSDNRQPDVKPKMPSDLKAIPGAKTMAYRVGKPGVSLTGATREIELWDLHDKDMIGWLQLKPTKFPMPNSVAVANVLVSNRYRGQGLGQSLYGVATKILGYTIVSDDTQTPEARKMWVYLSKIPGMEIAGWLDIMRRSIDPEEARNEYDDRDIKRYQALIAKLQGLAPGQAPVPMPRQKYGSYVYYSFPVVAGPDGKELEAAQKVVAIYTREHPEDSMRAVNTGLYARWQGS
jgi:hypothetical protein